MAKVPHGVEILPKISIAWVGCTNVTDDRQTTDKQTDRRWHIANMNLSSRSLKILQIVGESDEGSNSGGIGDGDGDGGDIDEEEAEDDS